MVSRSRFDAQISKRSPRAGRRPARAWSGPIKLSVKIVPGSSRDCIAGWLGETLKIRVIAPPERGKANAAVVAVVAAALGITNASVRVVHGNTSPRKTLEIAGLTESEVRRRLSEHTG